jgi:hypothetical protein
MSEKPYADPDREGAHQEQHGIAEKRGQDDRTTKPGMPTAAPQMPSTMGQRTRPSTREAVPKPASVPAAKSAVSFVV